MRLRTIEEKEVSWSELQKALKNGTAQELLTVGSQLIAEHEELGMVVFDVLDFDKEELPSESETAHSITLQMHSLIMPEMEFDKNGKNKWEDSTIRQALNAEEFINGFENEFRKLLTEVYKKNDDREKTKDKFFLLSVEEMTEIDERYRFYDNRANMCKQDGDGYGRIHWTRSAFRGFSCTAWSVHASGGVSNGYAYNAWRCAPACVIAG